MMSDASSTYEQVYATVCQIPPGQVSSYGRIAALSGLPGQARLVGYALHALRLSGRGDTVPWWRVINAAGRISNRYEPGLQRQLLAAEGVAFDAAERVDLGRFLWDGVPPAGSEG